ncbi:UDP-N-acetyl-D-glucosamine dehydrogenase [Nocardioides flavus (ex Wang et al. 2016)]|uniref:UDP-N-acetyl-D-glucosamine dehydrogenase n=1 Tax=Nocardioides flavus (ex Wang et al. 2016) TaxID=2058780 RepID=A0ABQ3HHX7_9ACTN|nr:nucleotide sugar dehydrogenase [Nocardioides flavus (ex Wang et al. 2016)]GHE14950.1 UDP-N-acetyl-D-glucosamine dehydrogenase [Nocardioides flavus (ex Wang et al. 2016)]
MTGTLVVIGQGYVGLPMALRAAEGGFKVYGLDTNAKTVEALNSGLSHIDDVSDDELRRGLKNGFEASGDPAVIGLADVVLVCVPTPLAEEGGPDLEAVRMAAGTIGDYITPKTLAILESTTYPGTTEEVFAPLVSKGGLTVGEDIFIAFSPERIDPGNEKYGVRNTPKVVGGMTEACTIQAVQFYTHFVDTVVPAKGAKEAEMSKLIENTFRHVNIALVNEMLRFSHELDIDLWNAIDCAETKPFGFMAFRPGPGVGGHCIPVDPSYLSHRVKARLGYSFRMVELAEEINTAAPLYVADRVRELLNERERSVKGAKILLLGVTYKANISDMRESPADPLAKRLIGWGADVSYHDPHVPQWQPHRAGVSLTSVEDPDQAASVADLTILLQLHSTYNLPALASRAKCMLDTRGVSQNDGRVAKL